MTKAITMNRILAIALASALAACAYERPNTIVSPKLDSGITSSNGGGMRALGDIPNVTLNSRVSPAR